MDSFGQIVGGIVVFAFAGLLTFAVLRVYCLVHGTNRGSNEDELSDDEADERCSECGYDLRASAQRCPECGTTRAEMRARRARSVLDPHALRDNWPEVEMEIRQPSAAEQMVLVHETINNSIEADLLVAQFHARGIQAEVRHLKRSEMLTRGFWIESCHLVMVPSGDEPRAREIIRSFRWDAIGDDALLANILAPTDKVPESL